MKRILALLLIMLSLIGCTPAENTHKDVLYQVATLSSLQMGGFDGVLPVRELRQHGDIGIGTFDGVNGEMIVLDGKVYQALADGTVQIAADDTTVPFSTVTYFEPDVSVQLTNIDSMNTLTGQLNSLVKENGSNNLYVVRISGVFDHLLVRSEYAQEKPYQMLSEAMKTSQVEYTFDQAEGTIVGFYFPDYFSQLNLAGWHFHFITADFQRGGHVLAMNFTQADAALDVTTGFEVFLPQDDAFQGLNLIDEHAADVKQIESAE